MKNKKWFTYTLGILLTLIVLAAVGAIGFRIGTTQNSEFARPMMNSAGPAFGHGFGMQGSNFHNQEFDGRGFHDRGFDRGGRSFFSPIFGLVKLAVLGALLWLGFKFVKNSGWRITRETSQPAPAASETPSVEVEEKKEAE